MSDGKYLSWVLRHRPDAVGLVLEPGGWVDVDALLEGVQAAGRTMSRAELERIVAEDSKARFSFNHTRARVRANQGHSVVVDLELTAEAPPPTLFHGTVNRFLDSIFEGGLLRGQRHHVHLSADRATASTVGSRRGKPVLLTVNAAVMAEDGYVFFQSANGVWLTKHVPSRYLSLDQ